MSKSTKTIIPLEDQMREWFRLYGSHVILHRAVPHLKDGLKPSQRRVLHSLWEMDDGRYNKAANIVGNTLKYHPHGDASVFETMVGIGQKGFLIDTQGNWGNTLTGDGAAAPRYIEARLTPFAKDCFFNPKTTEWADSYDGRNKEPVSLPAKFPLLLLQGTEGIAVSMACKILPHNFRELAAAAIAYLKGEEFTLIPDFPLGGTLDASAYNGGANGGKIKVRAQIEHGKNQLEITEIPYGTTTISLRESILKAEEKGKIKIKKIHDMTSESASLVIEFPPGTDLDRAEEALYAFTDCEIAHTIIGSVIRDGHPEFLSTSEILTSSVENTKALIKRELEIELEELAAQWHKLNLERIFIRTKAYLELETAKSAEEGRSRITAKMRPHWGELRHEPTDEDITALTELRIRRISAFDDEEGKTHITNVEKKEREAKRKLKALTQTTIEHFERVLEKYGKDQPRKCRIAETPFGKIEAAEVAVANQKLYWNPKEGFIGTGLKKDEPLGFEINEMTDVAAINHRGILKVNRPGQKAFFGENLLDARPVGKNGEAPIYYMAYLDKESGTSYVKAFQVNSGFTRDREYPLAGGSNENPVLFLKVQDPKEPAPTIKVQLKPDSGARKLEFDFDFSTIAVKNRDAQGNILTKYATKSVK